MNAWLGDSSFTAWDLGHYGVCCKEMTRGNCWQKTRWIFIGKTRDTHMTPRLVRRSSETTTASGASGHLWATRTADLGLSGGSQRRSEVTADD